MSVSSSLAYAEQLPALERVRKKPVGRRELVRRTFLLTDATALSLAFAATVAIFGLSSGGAHARPAYELAIFFVSLPAWVLLASMHGLYRHDEGRFGHSTVDDVVGVVHVVTLGAWVFFLGCWLTGVSSPRPEKLLAFWLFATVALTVARACARAYCVRSDAYVQRTIVVGGGEVGQLVARKLLHHREYGVELVGIVDEEPKRRRADLGELPLLGSVSELRGIVANQNVERVVIAFSNHDDGRTAEVVRSVRAAGVQITSGCWHRPSVRTKKIT